MSNETLLLGTRKGLLIFHRGGNSWRLARECFLGVRATYAMQDPRDGTLWCGLDNGHFGCKLHRSGDLGETWTEVPSPKYHEGALVKPGKPATLSYIWCIAAGHAMQPGRMYLGTIPGGLFASDDGGESWSLCEGLWNHPSRAAEQWMGGGFDDPGVHSILVDPQNADRVRVGISVAGMFETVDGGKTWSPKNRGLTATFLPDPNVEVGHDPHLVAACASNFEGLWQQNHCGIFRSVDGGTNWTAVHQTGGPAFFGFAVAVDENNADVAWVVPAASDEQRVAIDRALCVCRTDDGGQTWRAFRAGLPQENCYDFAFRHGLDVRGNRLALGTTGGGLYVSDDLGETWQAVAAQLPPVYSSRWAGEYESVRV